MSEERAYGVECKNPECHTGIILGSYLTRPERAGDMVSFVIVKKAGRVRCPDCKRDYEYDQGDIREFPKWV
jgi:hypothetical protein